MVDYKSCMKDSGALLMVAALMILSFAIGAVPENSILGSSDEGNSEDTGQSVTAPTGTTFSKSNSAEGEEINWQVISGGGDIGGVSTNYRLSGTVAQTVAGYGESDNFGLTHGFWQSFGGTTGYLCGDANCDGTLNIADAVYLITYIFKGGPEPCCP